MPSAMVALANLTLSSPATSVTFASIPGTYRDLRLVVNAAVSTEGNVVIQFNGDTGSNYVQVNMRCFSTSSVAATTTTTTSVVSNYSTGLQPSSRALNTYDIMDYSQTDKHKAVLVRANHTDELDTIAARWASTSAITSIVVSSANYTTGSTFCLYGIVSS